MTYPDPRGSGTPRRGGPSWDQLFSPDDFAPAPTQQLGARRPSPGPRRPPLFFVIAALAAVLLVTGLTIWFVRPADDEAVNAESSVTATTSAAPTAPAKKQGSAEQERTLAASLPAGYTPTSCTAAPAPVGIAARLTCTRNGDAGGPQSATYSLAEDADALTTAFNALVRSSVVVDCPGRIQSPGPWRRTAQAQPAGTLVCTGDDRAPAMAWTTSDKLLLSVVEAGVRGPTAEALYAWWSKHS